MRLPAAKIIADSQNGGHRVTTMQVRLHRFVLAELNTHRVLSKNSASSRAVPVETMLKRVMEDPALPLHWGKNQKGMQAEGELASEARVFAETEWLAARDSAVHSVTVLAAIGLHKQVANRLLEPFMWHEVIITGTEWTNFFGLRCHKDAQPEMQAAAVAMYRAYKASTPVDRPRLFGGNESWHLPYITEEERSTATLDQLLACSSARCARVSYLTHDGENPSLEKDLALFARLSAQVPAHSSPLEHQGRPATSFDQHLTGNFRGWVQHRKILAHENIATILPHVEETCNAHP